MTIWKCPCPAFSLMYKHTYLHMHCTYRRYFSPIIEIISRWPRKARITTVKVTQRSNGTLWLYFAPNKSHYVIICHPLPATPPKNNNQKKAAGWGGDGEDELRWGVCVCVCLPACVWCGEKVKDNKKERQQLQQKAKATDYRRTTCQSVINPQDPTKNNLQRHSNNKSNKNNNDNNNNGQVRDHTTAL